MSKVINIIGAGRLGKTIAKLIVRHHAGTIGGVYARSLEAAQSATDFIGEGMPCCDLQTIPPADFTLIATPDDTIAETAVKLCQHAAIKKHSVFIHCSGVLTSDVMAAVRLKQAKTVSIHPMKSFSDPDAAVASYAGTYCAIEGEVDALEPAAELFRAFGSIVYPIDKNKKPLYHAAGVFASNYLVTLANQAVSCLNDSGVDESMSLKIVLSLMKGSLDNIERSMSPMEALTGPIKRGDVETLQTHLASFPNQTRRTLYAALGQATLELTNHDDQIREKISSLLH
jgi:predicted short-subunit dehydrogenase-like oxidoreductase (DUF2520 family)